MKRVDLKYNIIVSIYIQKRLPYMYYYFLIYYIYYYYNYYFHNLIYNKYFYYR